MPYRMTTASLMNTWRRLSAEKGGNVTVTFAVALVPLLALVGTAVDYSRASAIRTAMQAAVDSTALAVAKNATTLTAAQIQSQADTLFKASFARTDVNGLTVTSAYSTAGGSNLVIGAKGTMKTTFLAVMGISEMNLSTTSTSTWGTTRLRVALVLDTTGSMDSAGKMSALKSATASLLDQLKTAATVDGDVYVSIVPFSKNINLNPNNYNASWIDWTDWEAEPAKVNGDIRDDTSKWEQVGPGSTCPFDTSGWGGTYKYGFGCTTEPTNTTATNSVPSSGTYAGYVCPGTDNGMNYSTKIGLMYNGCYKSIKETRTISTGSWASCGSAANCSCSGNGSNKKCTQTYYDHPWVINAHSTWNGCVTDRGTSSAPSQDLDRLISAPGTSAVTKYPAEQNAYCSPAVTGLNYDWTTMKSSVNSLYPLGATNQPIGLVWGWQSLVGGGPFTSPAKTAGYSYQEAIILMSDGLNTLDRWYGNGSATSTAVDKRMYDSTSGGAGTCANIKATGVTIYTIHVNTDGSPTSTLLKNCASDPDSKFWMITSASQLVTVFNQIGTNLSQLRLAK
jgi:Flp pilus assembly protein TadG